jgi:hypothetical protein
MTSQHRLTDYNQCTNIAQDADSRGVCGRRQQKVYGKSLHLPLDFARHLKLKKISHSKNNLHCGAWWLMPVVPATQEVLIRVRRIKVQGQANS